MKRAELINKQVRYANDVWKVVGVGAERDNATYLHLASTTNFRQQKNGPCPHQICCYIPDEDIVANLEL